MGSLRKNYIQTTAQQSSSDDNILSLTRSEDNLDQKKGHDRHFAKGMRNDLLDFLNQQSVGYEEVFIMDPYFCKRSLEIVRDMILSYNRVPSFKILKCKSGNEDNEEDNIVKVVSSTECLWDIKLFSTLKDKTFHNRYLVFRKSSPEKGDRGVKIFVLSDSYYKITESELDIVYQTDDESAYSTIIRYETAHCKPNTDKQIYPLVGGENAK